MRSFGGAAVRGHPLRCRGRSRADGRADGTTACKAYRCSARRPAGRCSRCARGSGRARDRSARRRPDGGRRQAARRRFPPRCADCAGRAALPRTRGRGKEIQHTLKELKKSYKTKVLSVPEDLCWLYGRFLEDYLHDVEICQAFARRNRERMAEIILEKTGMSTEESFHTIHNYIDTEEMILRKGAIAARKGEKVLIPVNMRDGSILAIGKGNKEWNDSAPHGAGRLMSRTRAKEQLDMETYKEVMKEVYTTSVNEQTLDEAPMAYKSLEDIIDVVSESVDVVEVMKPVFNFKAS